MSDLAKNTPRIRRASAIDLVSCDKPVAASVHLYDGAALGLAAGYANNILAATRPFLGIAVTEADNAAGAAGDKKVDVLEQGFVELTVVGVDGVDDEGKRVYATDGNVFTLTAAGGELIGTVFMWISSTKCIVFVQSARIRASGIMVAAITSLTDNTGLSGTHDDTLAATTVPADITGGEAPTEAEHNAALAVMRVLAQNASDTAQKVIELNAALRTAGILATA